MPEVGFDPAHIVGAVSVCDFLETCTAELQVLRRSEERTLLLGFNGRDSCGFQLREKSLRNRKRRASESECNLMVRNQVNEKLQG